MNKLFGKKDKSEEKLRISDDTESPENTPVTNDAQVEITSQAEPVPATNLSPEELQLQKAKDALREIIERDGSLEEEMPARDIMEAQKALAEAQARLQRVKDEKSARFHEANKKVLEAEADVREAKRQKEIFESVSASLKKFKETEEGKNVPDDIALFLAPMFEIMASGNQYTTIQQVQHQFLGLRERLVAYYAYRRRLGIDK